MVKLRLVVAFLALLVAIPTAKAQEWPNRPVRFIVPFPAGGSTDVGARLIGEYLSRSLRRQIVVENKSGANGNIGIETAAKSPADGYTVLVVTDALTSNPHVYKMNVEPLKALTPVIQLSRQPMVLAAHPSLGVASLAELIALARQQPGLRYATGSGVGAQHMVAQWFASIVGIRLEQVPYRGGAPALNDLIAGHVQLGSLGSTPLIPRCTRTTRPARCGCSHNRPRNVRPAYRTCRTIRRRASRGWCSTSGSGCSCRWERRRRSECASTVRSMRRSPKRRSARASCNPARSRSAAAPKHSRNSFTATSRRTHAW